MSSGHNGGQANVKICLHMFWEVLEEEAEAVLVSRWLILCPKFV